MHKKISPTVEKTSSVIHKLNSTAQLKIWHMEVQCSSMVVSGRHTYQKTHKRFGMKITILVILRDNGLHPV